jgi:hypothetical protein
VAGWRSQELAQAGRRHALLQLLQAVLTSSCRF